MTTLILVTGAPGSGKTTLAKRLAGELRMPLFYKDRIKEALFDALPAFDQSLSKELGRASFPILYNEARACLGAGVSCMIESNFKRGISEQEVAGLVASTGARFVQILCRVPNTVAYDRAVKRWESGNRHPGHQDHIWTARTDIASLHPEIYILDVEGEFIEVDTSDFEKVDYAGIVARVADSLK